MSIRNSSWSLNRFKASFRASSVLAPAYQTVELLSERRLRLDQGGIRYSVRRGVVAVLAAKKVLPQKSLAPSSRASKGKVFLSLRNRVPVLSAFFSVSHDEIEELVEGFQRLGRVGARSRHGELFDEHGGQPQLLLIGGIGQFLSVAIPDIEAVVQLAFRHSRIVPWGCRCCAWPRRWQRHRGRPGYRPDRMSMTVSVGDWLLSKVSARYGGGR